VLSLLEYTDHTYYLVSNGCKTEEEDILRVLASRYDRLEVFIFPTASPLPHGNVLDVLYRMSRDRYFCFLDSDIFALSQLPDLESKLQECNASAIFSALPVWLTQEDSITQHEYKMFFGTNSTLVNVGSIGNSYFAIYDREKLDSICNMYDASFSKIAWEQLSYKIKDRLSKNGLERSIYDTGKVINALMITENMLLCNLQFDSLCHLGGFSISLTRKNRQLRSKGEGVLDRIEALCHPEEFRKKERQRESMKLPVQRYFLKLYHALSNPEALPKLPRLDNKEVLGKFSKAKDDYIELYNKYAWKG